MRAITRLRALTPLQLHHPATTLSSNISHFFCLSLAGDETDRKTGPALAIGLSI
jgi:hypothetical protein